MAAGLALAVIGLSVTGCRTTGPSPAADSLVRVSAGSFDAGFAAATEVLAEHGLHAEVVDRDAGIIESGAVESIGWFAPWDLESDSSLEAEATGSTLRRRARVTFTPAAFADVGGGDAGADILGLRSDPAPSASDTGPLELRVAVFVERAHRPGRFVDTWSRRLANQARVGRTDRSGAFEPTVAWWPVARDAGLERRLLESIASRLAPDDPGEPAGG